MGWVSLDGDVMREATEPPGLGAGFFSPFLRVLLPSVFEETIQCVVIYLSSTSKMVKAWPREKNLLKCYFSAADTYVELYNR